MGVLEADMNESSIINKKLREKIQNTGRGVFLLLFLSRWDILHFTVTFIRLPIVYSIHTLAHKWLEWIENYVCDVLLKVKKRVLKELYWI